MPIWYATLSERQHKAVYGLCHFKTPPSPSSHYCTPYTVQYSTSVRSRIILYIRVKWFSTFFRFLKIYTFLLIRYIFRSLILKNRQFRPRACGAKFPFSKNHRGLKYECFFCKKLQNPSIYIKEPSPKRKYKIKSCLIFFKNSQKRPKRFLI